MGTMTLSDLNGRTLLLKQLTGNEIISVSMLPKGIYVTKLITIEGTIIRKVVKE